MVKLYFPPWCVVDGPRDAAAQENAGKVNKTLPGERELIFTGHPGEVGVPSQRDTAARERSCLSQGGGMRVTAAPVLSVFQQLSSVADVCFGSAVDARFANEKGLKDIKD